MTQLDRSLNDLTPVAMTRVEQFDGHVFRFLVLRKSKILAKQRKRVKT